jgi:DNA-binding transcriptional ArsR family regulator
MATLTRAATVLKTLGHSGRLRILSLLQAGPLSVCQIATALGMPLSTLSGHLLELRRADLVSEQRRGKWVFYRLTSLDAVTAVLDPVLAAIADDPIVRRDAANAAALEGKPLAAVCEAAASTVVQVRP